MIIKEVKKYLENGENEQVEFKESRRQLDSSVFESVCAFLNYEGGVILLCVKNDGTIIGIDKSKVEEIKKEFIATSNNWQKLTLLL